MKHGFILIIISLLAVLLIPTSAFAEDKTYTVISDNQSLDLKVETEGNVKSYTALLRGTYEVGGKTYYKYSSFIIVFSDKKINNSVSYKIGNYKDYYYVVSGPYDGGLLYITTDLTAPRQISTTASYFIDCGKLVHNNNSIQSDLEGYGISTFCRLIDGETNIQGLYDLSKFDVDSDGNLIAKNFVVDLPTLKNVRVIHTSDMDRFEFRLRWDSVEPSENYSTSDLKLEVKSMSYFKMAKYAWSDYIYFDVAWHSIVDDYDLYKSFLDYDQKEDYYCVMHYRDMMETKYDGRFTYEEAKRNMLITRLGKEKIAKAKYPSFMVRYYYDDEQNGIRHYSNWVQLTDSGNCDGYIANEVTNWEYDKTIMPDGSEQVGAGDKTTSLNVDNSSGLYDGSSDVMKDTDDSSLDTTMPTNLLKRIIKDVKEFPDFFGKFFSFLPINYSNMFSLLITVIMAVGIFRKIFI